MKFLFVALLFLVSLYRGTFSYIYVSIYNYTTLKYEVLLYACMSILAYWICKRVAPLAGLLVGWMGITSLNVLYSNVAPYSQLEPLARNAFYFATLFSGLKFTLIAL